MTKRELKRHISKKGQSAELKRWKKIGPLKSQAVLHEMSEFSGDDRSLFDLFFVALEETTKGNYNDYFSSTELVYADESGQELRTIYSGTNEDDFQSAILFLPTDSMVWCNVECRKKGSYNFSMFRSTAVDDNKIHIQAEDWAIYQGDLYRANY